MLKTARRKLQQREFRSDLQTKAGSSQEIWQETQVTGLRRGTTQQNLTYFSSSICFQCLQSLGKLISLSWRFNLGNPISRYFLVSDWCARATTNRWREKTDWERTELYELLETHVFTISIKTVKQLKANNIDEHGLTESIEKVSQRNLWNLGNFESSKTVPRVWMSPI